MQILVLRDEKKIKKGIMFTCSGVKSNSQRQNSLPSVWAVFRGLLVLLHAYKSLKITYMSLIVHGSEWLIVGAGGYNLDFISF